MTISIKIESVCSLLRQGSTIFIKKYNRSKIIKMKSVVLSGTKKDQIPVIGLGTWQASTQEIEEAVFKALDLGYRHIDTAFNYNNEEAIGNALKKYISSGGCTREDLFITTKLPHVGNRAKDVAKFLNLSLQRLQLDYLDLYLIHVPFAFVCDEKNLTPVVKDGNYELDNDIDHIETWKVMEEQVEAGKIRNIGISNFNESQIEKIYNNSKIKPCVLQVEVHAYFQQKELRKFCKEKDIKVTAYAPIGSPGAKTHFITKYNYSPDDFPDLLGHPLVKELSDKYKKSPAQILLKHLVQNDIIVIPKSSNPKRIEQNISIFDFELSEDDLQKLNDIDQGEKGRIFNFMFWKGVEKHREYPFKHILI